MKMQDIELNDKLIYELSKQLYLDNITYQSSYYVNKNIKDYFDYYCKLEENKNNKLFMICYNVKIGLDIVVAKYEK